MRDVRGLTERFLAVGRQLPTYHFALLENRLDFTILDTPFPYALFLPQPKTEALQREHLDELGVMMLGEHAVRGVRQQDDLVVVEAETAREPPLSRLAGRSLRAFGSPAHCGYLACNAALRSVRRRTSSLR